MNYCRKLSIWSAIVVSAGILFIAVPSQAAKPSRGANPVMHKCSDDKGRVFYSDRPDLDCPQSVGMSKHGVKLDKPAPVQPAAAQSKKTEPTAEAIEQARRDQAIMQTYTSASQIEESKSRNLEPPTQAVKLAQRQLERATAKRDALKKQTDGLTLQKKPLPAGLSEDLRLQEEEVMRLQEEALRRQAHADQIAARFDADLRRYRELTGAAESR